MRFLVFLLLAGHALGNAYSLFDGSFNGWEGDTRSTWRIEENAFTAGSTDRLQPRNEFLCTKREFTDFDLSLQWKLAGTEGFVNGGVQFRTRRIPDHHEVSGYQADLGAGYDGALYDESRRSKMLAQPSKEILAKASKPAGAWNSYRIRAEGPRIQIWLNGIQTVDYTEPDPGIPRSGIIGVQIHGDAKSQVWYRNITIEELGPKKESATPKGPTARFADSFPPLPREPFPGGKFQIREGEVVVFTGGTNMVRLVEDGSLESMIALSSSQQKPRFRSMAWEGDTVYEQWRDINFGSWQEQLEAAGASCVFLWFGQMEALDDTRDDAAFESHARQLLDEFAKVTPRLVILAPLPFQSPPADAIGCPDRTGANPRISRLSAILRRLATERGAIFTDAPGTTIPTTNGIHLPSGQSSPVASHFHQQLTSSPAPACPPTLRDLIARKNTLWHDCWKTMNWAFAYSDRTEQPFGQGIGSHPPLAAELEQYKPLIRTADALIHEAATGKPVTLPAPPAPPPSPPTQPADAELATFKVREGFAVNLFASEADGLVKPLSMRWDHRGRLWAACSPSYPQLQPGLPHEDYILICEDTNADGKADRFHRFASGLTMPMGIEFATDGSVYVCESTQLARFRDTDNDGTADSREVILSGFGTGDSHQMINSLRWGPDGCLWFSQGLHIFSRIETPHGIVQFDRAGLWRFNPRTWKLQGFFGNAAAGANCWGVTFDNHGQVFHCAADNTPGFFTTPGLGALPNPPSYYQTGSLAVSPVKGMCLEFLSSPHLPSDLDNVLCKPVYFGSQLLLYRLHEDGSGFRTDDLGPLLTSSSNVFRPLAIQTGPDGALYVCDWFNPVIGHYQASYRDPNRDKSHGRIWRLTATGRALSAKIDLTSASASQLAALLQSPERWVREQARLRLASIPDGLPESVWKASEDAHLLLECLATSAIKGSIPPPLLLKCLSHPSAELRAFAIRMGSQLIPDNPSRDNEIDALRLLGNAINDPSPRVRLEAVIAASYLPSPRAVEVALGCLDHPRDRFIDYALTCTIRALKPSWAPALEQGRLTCEGNLNHLAHLLATDGNPDTASALERILASGKAPADQTEKLRILLIASGNPAQLTTAVKAGPLSPEIANALATAIRSRKVQPDLPQNEIFADWEFERDSLDPIHLAMCRLAGSLGRAETASHVLTLTASPSESIATAAVAAWAEYRESEAIPDLVQLAGAGPAAVRIAAITALFPLSPPDARAVSIRNISSPSFLPENAAALVRVALASQGSPDALASDFVASPPPAESALAMLRALATAGRSEPALAASLRKAAGLPENASILPDYSPEAVTALVRSAQSSGDASKGAAWFRAPQAACLGCHQVGPEGGTTGPNLTSLGRGMTPELITESVLWPHRQIKEGYFLTTITTKDGRIASGYRVREDKDTLVLRTPGSDATEHIATARISERSDTGSLMPDGLTSWMTDQQRLDLLRYLFELGKEP